MNRKTLLLACGVVAAVLGITLWLRPAPIDAPPHEREGQTPAAGPSPSAPEATAVSAPVEARVLARKPTATDPRLAALVGAPGDALVEYRAAPDGRVIQEIDLDPNSQGYLKPMREYQYAGDRLAVVTVYKYLGTQLQVTRATATYKADGSIDVYNETVEYRKP